MARSSQLRELRRRRVPAWWTDAKLGIFVHWTPASVPAFAPVDVDIGQLVQSGRPDALASTPYTEWYENSLCFPDSPVARHHRATFGARPYRDFAADWIEGLESFDPHSWAAAFAAAGARYVVLVSKHMDGFCLWPSEIRNPHRADWYSPRDVVGELGEAVRAAGMRFGLYYSGGLDSTFNDHPIGTVADLIAAVPRGKYPAYADAQVRELIRRYRPSVLWNDIAWPAEARQLFELFAHYYRQVPDGVVNDRWLPWSPVMAAAQSKPGRALIDLAMRRQAVSDGGVVPPKPPHFDYRTPEYVVFDEIQSTPWECVRGMDRSFGYNAWSRPEHFLGHEELLFMLVDIAAKGGRLLLNVGPRGVDAQIPEPQLERLGWLRDWVGTNEIAVGATRPWIRPGTTTAEGLAVRYTCRANAVYAIVEPGPGGTVTLADLAATPTTAVLGIDGAALDWREVDRGLAVELSHEAGVHDEPRVIVFSDVSARSTVG